MTNKVKTYKEAIQILAHHYVHEANWSECDVVLEVPVNLVADIYDKNVWTVANDLIKVWRNNGAFDEEDESDA